MTESDMTAILLAFQQVMDGPMRELRAALPEAIKPEGPTLGVFDGHSGTGGAGMFAIITACHEDGRSLSWEVEIWIEPGQRDRPEWIGVKGEIDLADDEGDPRCVLNEQQNVSNGPDAAQAINDLAVAVSNYPIAELLTKRWGPENAT